MNNTRVSRSPLHGKGLFARRAFRTGETVECIEGNIVLRESNSKYAIALSGRRSLILTGKVKFVNAAWGIDANVVFNVRKGLLIAIADIADGDELIARYAGIW